MTEAESKAERHYYETLDLAQLVGRAGDDPEELLIDCANALARIRASLVAHYEAPPPSKVN